MEVLFSYLHSLLNNYALLERSIQNISFRSTTQFFTHILRKKRYVSGSFSLRTNQGNIFYCGGGFARGTWASERTLHRGV
jgi:hypothetical protein